MPLVKQGKIDQFNIINIAAMSETAKYYRIKSIPWLKIGHFVFEGLQTRETILFWLNLVGTPEGMQQYLSYLLEHHRLNDAIKLCRDEFMAMSALIQLFKNPEIGIDIRIGISALMESLEADACLIAIIPELGLLTQATEQNIRIDACHFLSLINSCEILPYLQACQNDPDPEIQELIREALEKCQFS